MTTRTYVFGHREGYHTLRNPRHFAAFGGYSDDRISIRRDSAARIKTYPYAGSGSSYCHEVADPAAATVWRVDYDHRSFTCHSPREVRQYIERLIADGARRHGQAACERLWAAICADQAARAKQLRTARDVLAIAAARKLVAAIGSRKYVTDLDYYCTRRVQAEAKAIWQARLDRRAAKKIADAARKGPAAGEMLRRLAVLQGERRHAAAEKIRARLLTGKLGRAAVAEIVAARKHLHCTTSEADALVRCVVRCVGTIGEQVERDLSEMRTGNEFSGKPGRHHRREVTTVERIEHLRDWSAALVTMRDYASYGSHRLGGGNGYGSVGGSKFRCYLVVRDSTTGEAHVLRVAPKFGNADTQFFGRFRSGAERIEAARASTFGVSSEVLAAAIES